ncbi:hypothetical protein CUAC110533_03485 [Cutibacterium acnes subsp. elongatum]
MKIRKKNQPLMQPPILLRHRLLHLQHQISITPHRLHITHNPRTSTHKIRIRNTRTHTSTSLNQHLMPTPNQRMNTRRRHSHTKLIILNLSRNTNTHHTLLTTTPANNNVGGPASVLIHNRSYASPYGIVSVIPSPVTETYPSSHVL